MIDLGHSWEVRVEVVGSRTLLAALERALPMSRFAAHQQAIGPVLYCDATTHLPPAAHEEGRGEWSVYVQADNAWDACGLALDQLDADARDIDVRAMVGDAHKLNVSANQVCCYG